MRNRLIILLFIFLSISAAKTQLPGTSLDEKYPSSQDLYRESGKVNILIKRKVNRKRQAYLGCTPGKLYINGEYFCRTLEKPFKDAERNISSIHPGIYGANLRYVDNKNQWRIQLQPITTYGYDIDPFIPNRQINRFGIQIHPGTKPEHSQGCILVGLKGPNPCELYRSQETFDRLLKKYFGSSLNPNQNLKITVIIRDDYNNH